MNLNELREAMASDATKENEELKRDLASLKKRYHKDTEHLRNCCSAQLEDMKALANRCWVLSRGDLCVFCELNTYKCPHSMNFDDKLREAKKLRKKERTKMIKLDVSKYCDRRPHFEPEVVEKPQVDILAIYSFCNMEEKRMAVTHGDTVVKCCNRDLCEAIYEYMEGLEKC